MSKKNSQIRDCLERLYARYNRKEFIGSDPLQFVYNYPEPADMEIVGFLAAGLAYGRVEQILKSLTDLLERMGDSPGQFVRDFGKGEKKRLSGFKHRFTTGQDIADLLDLLRDVLEQSGNIEKYFLSGYSEDDENIIPALSRFCDSLRQKYACAHNGRISRGLKYLLTTPADGSACKRLNLFLRWMVRDDEVDLGLWRAVDRAKLIVPIDVHISRLCKILGFHNSKTVSLSTALEITKSFSEIESSDPVKYDFALTRVGIVEDCDGNYRPRCRDCELFEFCCK